MKLYKRKLNKDFLSDLEGKFLYENLATTELMWIANELRQKTVPGNIVTWQIDRNVNTTNVLIVNFVIFLDHQNIPRYTLLQSISIRKRLMKLLNLEEIKY